MNDFFANIFELWGFSVYPISTDLYDSNMFATIGMVWLLVTLGAVLTYYFVVNSPRYSKPRHWIFTMLITSFLITLFALIYPMKHFNYEGLGYVFGDYVLFILIVFLFSLFWFFLSSFIVKRFSVNCSKTPF